MTPSDILDLQDAPDDTTVVIWSLQKSGAIDRLLQEGRLSGDPTFAFVNDKDDRKRFSYNWMQDQMARRIVGRKSNLPIWALLVPQSHSDQEDSKLLRIEVQKSQMLISFVSPWVELQLAFSHLWRVKNWPAYWPEDICPYAAVDAHDVRESVCNQANMQRRTNWDEGKCRASWERIFELRMVNRPNFLWGTMLQATIPYIRKDEVTDIRPPPQVS